MKKFEKEYQIVSILGRGSYGEVALGRARTTKKEYALKFYSLSQLTKINKLYSIKRAMKIVQQLQSPYIVKLYQYVYDHQKLMLRYEACPFGTLEEFLRRFTYRSEDMNKQLICQMAEILEYLALVQVIHRDVKPSNLVFGQEGFLKLIDFDQAATFDKNLITQEDDIKIMRLKFNGGHSPILKKSSSEIKELLDSHHSRLRQQTYVGTPCYMPPEMKDRRSYDEKGDIWSFGCIIYELLVCETYFTEQDEDQQLDQERKTYRLTKIQSNVGGGGYSFLTEILSKDPKLRPDIKQILQHPFLREFRLKKSLRLETRKQIVMKLRQRLAQKEHQESTDDLKFSQFFSGFQILKQIKVHTIVLKKGWYFFSPAILKSNQKGFNFYNDLQTQLQDRVLFSQVLQISEVDGQVELRTDTRTVKLRHILAQNGPKLKEAMEHVFTSFK